MSTAPRDTGKLRSQRIEHDYYKQPSGIGRWKAALAIAGAIFGIATVAYSLSDPGVANPGPLVTAHASFEQDCGRCHTTLSPIGADSLRNLSIPGVLDIKEHESVRNIFDKCTSCHNGEDQAGDPMPIGDHFLANLNQDDNWHLVDMNCAACHVDHQGRDFDLNNVGDAKCVQCHDKLDQVRQGGRLVANDNVTAFTSAGHGDFLSLVSDDPDPDPGNVIFDHAQHMMLGQSADGKDVIRLGDLEPEMREQYRAKMEQLKASAAVAVKAGNGNEQSVLLENLDTSDNGLVQLDCSSCHQLDGRAGPSKMAADAELGRYMAPISFDQHCSACHPMNPAGRVEKTMPLPHAASWTEMQQWITAKLASRKLSRESNSTNPTGIGITKNPSPTRQDLETAWLNGRRDELVATVRFQCQKCHGDTFQIDQSDQGDEAAVADENAKTRPKPFIPERWLKFGIYDHAAHLSVDCKHCHEQAYAPGTPAEPGNDQNVVMISSSIEKCTVCHRPAELRLDESVVSNATFGGHAQWASDRCTMCHRYHGTGPRAVLNGPTVNLAETE